MLRTMGVELEWQRKTLGGRCIFGTTRTEGLCAPLYMLSTAVVRLVVSSMYLCYCCCPPEPMAWTDRKIAPYCHHWNVAPKPQFLCSASNRVAFKFVIA